MMCWYCGKEEMEETTDLPRGWLTCPECYATWIKMPKLGVSLLQSKPSEGMGGTKSYTPRVSRRKVKNATNNSSVS